MTNIGNAQPKLFIGGTVFDGLGQTLTEHGVMVEHGRISKVAPADEFAGYAGERVELSGRTLLPGLIDCHVHLCFDGSSGNPRAILAQQSVAQTAMLALRNARAALQGGITAVRDCGGRAHLEFAVRDAIASGDFIGPTIRAAGQMICMTGGHGHFMGRVADGCEDVIKAVREQIHAGSDLIKLMATGGVMTPGVNPEDAHFSPEELCAGVSEAKRFQRKTASHAQGTAGILNAVRAGVDSIEHGIYMNEQTLTEMLAAKTYLVPTLAAVRNILANAANGVPEYAVEKSRRVEIYHRESIRLYYEAGGRIAMGTDAGTPFNVHGHNADELAHMVDIGMKPVDALIASTSNAADLMGLDDCGVIADGRMADFLITEGDPVTDIRYVADRSFHRGVYKQGKLVDLQ